MQSISRSIIDAMLHAGVQRVYTVPCDLVWLLRDIEATPALQLISVRHESSATFMADADARFTGKPAVVIVGRSVGATNASNGVDTARDASTPMLILVNDVDTAHARLEAFQKMDLAAFYAPITKRCFAAEHSDSLPDIVSDALRIATQGRPGPVMISIPTDMVGEAQAWQPRAIGSVRPIPVPAPDAIQHIAQKLAGARRPVLIAGGGTRRHRAALIAFAEKFSLGVYCSFRRQDAFPNDHPLYLGHLGMYAPAATLQALRDADVVMVLGSKLNQMTTQRFTLPLPSADIIQVDIDPARVGAFRSASLGVCADIGATLDALLAASEPTPHRDWAESHAHLVQSSVVPPDRSQAGVDPAQVIKAMAEVLPADSIMTSEAGGYASFLHQHWTFRHADTQAAPTTGTMGYSVPAAVAAKLANPMRCVVALVGDGGFLMNGQEVETAIRYGLAIIVVVFNNRSLSGGGYLEDREYTQITDTDFAGYARVFGGNGITVRQSSELIPAFEAALRAKTFTIIDVKTDPSIATPGHKVRVAT